jgi:hypothetical protein
MSFKNGVIQLRQTNFSNPIIRQTNLHGKYKFKLVNVSVGHPAGASNKQTIDFRVNIQQLNTVIDNQTELFFNYQIGKSILDNPIQFPEVFINGQIIFTGLSMDVITELILTFEYEKTD